MHTLWICVSSLHTEKLGEWHTKIFVWQWSSFLCNHPANFYTYRKKWQNYFAKSNRFLINDAEQNMGSCISYSSVAIRQHDQGNLQKRVSLLYCSRGLSPLWQEGIAAGAGSWAVTSPPRAQSWNYKRGKAVWSHSPPAVTYFFPHDCPSKTSPKQCLQLGTKGSNTTPAYVRPFHSNCRKSRVTTYWL